MKGKGDDTSRLTRRDFLKTTAGVGAAAVVDARLAGASTSTSALEQPAGDREVDVVVVGAGATGLPAAIAAREDGASVIIVESNYDVGGHAILSNGNVALGGGTRAQKQFGIEDSPDLVFSDLTDWSVVESNGFPDYRYNDKEVVRAFADHSAATYHFLVAHGVVFADRAPDDIGASATGNSAPRENHTVPLNWPLIQTGKPVPQSTEGAGVARAGAGVGLVRPLEASARKLGAEILLRHRMTALIRENGDSGRVIGITVENEGRTFNIRARKGVILGTGGSTSNVNFRRMFDPRLTEEYCGVAGEPYTPQDGSGEIAAMAVGASLWGCYNQTGEFGMHITKAARVGCQYSYANTQWEPDSPIFHLARAVGLRVRNHQDVILVNKAGMRFYDETKGQFSANNYDAVENYVPHSWRNAANIQYRPRNFLNAALAGVPGEAVNGGGPIWAIFDADAVTREEWTVEPPYVDIAGRFFFSAGSMEELARAIDNKYQRPSMPPGALPRTVERYNGFVDSGKDEDFDKPKPLYKIETPPFYAAWATPVVHDTRVGLRINANSQVLDLQGQIIPGLYCGGESAGGMSLHGLARCVVQGRLAGMHAAAEG